MGTSAAKQLHQDGAAAGQSQEVIRRFFGNVYCWSHVPRIKEKHKKRASNYDKMKTTTSYTFFFGVLVSQLCSVVLFQCIFIIHEQCEEFNSRSVPCNPGLHRCISCSAAHYPKRDSNNHSKQVLYEHVNSHDIGKSGKAMLLLFNSHQWHVTILGVHSHISQILHNLCPNVFVEPMATDAAEEQVTSGMSGAEDRRNRVKAARLQRSSFTEDATSLIRRVSDAEHKGGTRVKMGKRLESFPSDPSGSGGGRHIDAEEVREMEALEDVKIRQLKLAASQLFQRLALLARYRQREQDFLYNLWGSRTVEERILQQATRILDKRRRVAEDNEAIILKRCADLATEWLQYGTVKQVRKSCEDMSKDVAVYQQEMLRLQQYLPQLQENIARYTSQVPEVFLEKLHLEREKQIRMKESLTPGEFQEDQEFDFERISSAMELLDIHEPKSIKVRMAGLKQSAIKDEDTFKRLFVEKFAEAINLDRDEIRFAR